jgi:hypothetical protein
VIAIGPGVHRLRIRTARTIVAAVAIFALALQPASLGCRGAWRSARFRERTPRAGTPAATVGWPTRLLVDRASLPRSDREFLWRLAHDTWRGLEALTDEHTELPWDHVLLRGESADAVEAHPGDYVTTSSIGLYLVAVVAAHELGFLDERGAEARIGGVIDSLERLETYRGYCFNFYKTRSLRPVGDLVSFVDAAWLSAGLIVARQALPALAERATRHLRQLDLGFFYDPAARLMSHGYYVNRAARAAYHYGVFFTEARLGSLIALGKGEVPWEHWAQLERDFAGCEVASLPSPTERGHRGETPAGAFGCRTWQHFHFVPSWGGSMFEALMPTLLFDEARHMPTTLGANARIHATIQKSYATDVLGYPVWGLSPSARPAGDSYAYGEFGVTVLGVNGYPAGVVSPHASALALAVIPEDAVANLRALADRYDVYGEFGFYDGVDPASGRVAHAYLALDQAMIMVAIANHLTAGRLRRLFEQDPIIQTAIATLRARSDLVGRPGRT